MSSKKTLAESDGIPVGFGMNAGIPVRAYVTGYGNANIEITGASGSGKTNAMKLIARRIARAHPSTQMLIIDPFDDYGEIAKECNLDSVPVGDSVPLFGGRAIVVLKDRSPDDPKRAELLVGALKSAWQRILDSPTDIIKVVIIDETHFLLKSPEGREIIETILSVGRKLNTVLLVSVQRVDSFGEDMSGNFGTRMFLHSTKGDTSPSGLCDADIREVSELERGFGLVTTADQRVYVRFE